VVFMQRPKETVHDVFMGKPGYKFHNTESNNKSQDPH